MRKKYRNPNRASSSGLPFWLLRRHDRTNFLGDSSLVSLSQKYRWSRERRETQLALRFNKTWVRKILGENKKKMGGGIVIKITFLIKGVEVGEIVKESMAVDAGKVCKTFCRVLWGESDYKIWSYSNRGGDWVRGQLESFWLMIFLRGGPVSSKIGVSFSLEAVFRFFLGCALILFLFFLDW